MCWVKNAPNKEDTFSLGKPPRREHGDETKVCKLDLLSCWSTQGFLLIKLKEIKFRCNQLPWAPQKYSRGREWSTFGSFHQVAPLLYEPCDDQVTGSARIASSRHRDPRPSLLDEGSSHFLPWLPSSRSSQQVRTLPFALYDGTKVPLGMQMSPAGCLPSRNLWPSCREKADMGNNQRTSFRHIWCTFHWTLQPTSFPSISFSTS